MCNINNMEDIQNCCRLCLDLESKHVSIIDDPLIILQIKCCLSLSIANDELPKSICLSCASRVNDFYNFQLSVRCSQDWFESCILEKAKKTTEMKVHVQPLPESEYNSDSLLEFLNITPNIEEYLCSLGKEDIPTIVNILDKSNDTHSDSRVPNTKPVVTKNISLKKNEQNQNEQSDTDMEIDILDSDIEIVKEILIRETTPKKTDYNSCFACKVKFNNVSKLFQHLSICDKAVRTCSVCISMFDSKNQMLQHRIAKHVTMPLTCKCGQVFENNQSLLKHYKVCTLDYLPTLDCVCRCKQCGETFKERFQLYKHARKHVIKAEEKICDICGHFFIGDMILAKHKKEFHKKIAQDMYRCKICSFTSRSQTEMYQHMKQHRNKSQELNRHLCEWCGCRFSNGTTLLRHALVHHRHREYQCSVCGVKFPDAKTRDEHVVTHTELSVCEKCGQMIYANILVSHICG